MNKLLAICGIVFIGNAATPNVEQIGPQLNAPTQELKCELQVRPVSLLNTATYASELTIDFQNVKEIVGENNDAAPFNINSIVFLEAEEELDLGFDTADYLPENFDPNKVYVDLNQVTYIDYEEDSLADFNTAAYLPEDFNPYAIPADIRAISYIEEEVELDFDTAPYLPEGFDPYEYYFDIHSVEYIEDEDEVELNFDTQEYLPRGFDPYSR